MSVLPTLTLAHAYLPVPPTRRFSRQNAEARPLAVRTIQQAFLDWKNACHRFETAKARYHASDAYAELEGPEGDEWSSWLDAVGSFKNDAEQRLIGCVLLSQGEIEQIDQVDEVPPNFKPVSFMVSGSTVIVGRFKEGSSRVTMIVIDSGRLDGDDCGNSIWGDEPGDDDEAA